MYGIHFAPKQNIQRFLQWLKISSFQLGVACLRFYYAMPPEVILPSPASHGSGMAGSSLRIQLGTLWFSQQVLKVLVVHLVYFYAESTSQWLLLKKQCSLGSEVHVQSTCYEPSFNVLINYFVGMLQIDLYTQCSGWEVRQ